MIGQSEFGFSIDLTQIGSRIRGGHIGNGECPGVRLVGRVNSDPWVGNELVPTTAQDLQVWAAKPWNLGKQFGYFGLASFIGFL